MKKCNTCGEELDESAFTKDKHSKDGLRSQCRACTNKYKKKFREENLDYVREQKRNSYLKHRVQILERQKNSQYRIEKRREHLLSVYGLTKTDYDDLRQQQNYRCVICNIHENDAKRGPSKSSDTALHVDHCHGSNKVRGLLCLNCNTMLGKVKDNVEILKSAINYLEKNQ